MKRLISILILLIFVINALSAIPVYAYNETEEIVASSEAMTEEEIKSSEHSDDKIILPDEITLVSGDEYELLDEISRSGIDGSFGSTNASVAEVDLKGTVKAISKGTADIIYIDGDGDKSVCKVNVSEKVIPLQSIKLNKSSVNLTVNQTETLKLTVSPNNASFNGSYSSDNNSVAAVDKNGKVTALKQGTANIKYKTADGFEAKCKVTVKNTTLPLKLNSKSGTVIYDYKLKKGTDFQIGYKKNNKPFFKVKYSSSNTKVATVSDSGLISPCGAGTAKIYVNADGAAATFSLTVVSTGDNSMTLNQIANRAAISSDSVTRYVYGSTVQGRELEAYIIKGSKSRDDKILFADFACHGFEDSYYRDGKVLVDIGNQVVEYFGNKPWYLDEYTLVVVPCANPDGTIAGTNNSRANKTAFGRCTAAHIDMNRDFVSFNAQESRALRSLFSKYNPDVYLNFHGWLNTSIGTTWLAKLSSSELSLNRVQKEQYVSGYIMTYVYKTYNASSCLVEYKSPDSAQKSVGKTENFLYEITHSNHKVSLRNYGWGTVGSKWRWYSSGKAIKGWSKINNKWYYFNSNGDMRTGWVKYKGKWYYLDTGGAMASGWRKVKGKWYYLNSNGTMASGWKKVSGKWYYMNSDGAMQTGFVKLSGKSYYLENSGAMAEGWRSIKSSRYYFTPSSGVMKTGWADIDKKTYYFDKSGVMANDYVKLNGCYYVFDKNGARLDEIKANDTLTAVDNVSEIKSNSVQLEWSKPNADVSGYQIVWSTDKDFKENVLTQSCYASENLSAIFFAENDTNYYVKVRAYKEYTNAKTVYFDWSAAILFTNSSSEYA